MGEKEYLIKGLKEFVKKLSRDFAVEKVILFGSRIRNKFKEYSDVDLIIVSDDFKGKDFFQRGARMYDYWNLDLPVDFLCYTKEEFDKLKKQISIVKEAVEEGIEIR